VQQQSPHAFNFSSIIPACKNPEDPNKTLLLSSPFMVFSGKLSKRCMGAEPGFVVFVHDAFKIQFFKEEEEEKGV